MNEWNYNFTPPIRLMPWKWSTFLYVPTKLRIILSYTQILSDGTAHYNTVVLKWYAGTLIFLHKVKVKFSSTLPSTPALDGGEWSTTRPGRFTPGKNPVPIV